MRPRSILRPSGAFVNSGRQFQRPKRKTARGSFAATARPRTMRSAGSGDRTRKSRGPSGGHPASRLCGLVIRQNCPFFLSSSRLIRRSTLASVCGRWYGRAVASLPRPLFMAYFRTSAITDRSVTVNLTSCVGASFLFIVLLFLVCWAGFSSPAAATD